MFGFGHDAHDAQPAFAGGWSPRGEGPRGEGRRGEGPRGEARHDEERRGPRGPWGEGPWGRGPWGEGPWGGGPRMGRMMRHFARRFPFGPGWPERPERPGPFGPGMGPRMFGRGDLKYGLLKLLEERPKHGYEMIKDLEQMTGGFYSPSAGAIYPTLQLLEDRGWVTAETVEGKKVYTISDAGRQALQENRERAEAAGPGRGPWGSGGHRHHHHGEGGPFRWESRGELRDLARESRDVAHLMRNAVMASGGDPERLARLRGIVERARGEIQAYLQEQQGTEAPKGEGEGTAPTGDGPTADGPTAII